MGLTNWLKPTDAGYWEMNPETGIARRTDMDETLPNTTVSTDAPLFREEAERSRRYAAAMTTKRSSTG
jgi:hypothetical protein